MPVWMLSSECGKSVEVEGDSWVEALQVALPRFTSSVFGARLSLDIQASGVVTATLVDEDIHVDVRERHPNATGLRRRLRAGTMPVLLDDHCKYVNVSSSGCFPIFYDHDPKEPLTEQMLYPGHDHTLPVDPADAPESLEDEIGVACARFARDASRGLVPALAGSLHVLTSFASAEGAGVRCRQGATDAWIVSEGCVSGVGTGPRVGRLRDLARTTGMTIAVRDQQEHRAGILAPVPCGNLPATDLSDTVLEVWRKDGRYFPWQMEVAQVAAAVLAEHVDGQGDVEEYAMAI